MATTYRISEWLLFFYIYCFLGWIWESSYVSIKEKRPVNRGFMKGPLLPIYGSGAICVLVVTLPVLGNYPLMAVIGMAAATVLEYVTGALMEAIFKVRYWDYSKEFLNIKGYICLKSTLCWGVMTFLVVYGIQEPISWIVEKLSPQTIVIMDYVITAAAAADFATSFKTAIDFREILLKAEQLKVELKGLQQRLDELEKQLTVSAGSAKESLMEFGSRTKDGIVEMGTRTKDGVMEMGTRTKDGVMGMGSRTKEQIMNEMQELRMKMGVKTEGLRAGYSKEMQGLLRRNPYTVSAKKYSETFGDLKEAIKARLGSRKEKEE